MIVIIIGTAGKATTTTMTEKVIIIDTAGKTTTTTRTAMIVIIIGLSLIHI